MSKSKSKKGVKIVRSAVEGILAFIISVVLFALSYCIVFQATFLNPDFIMESMNASNYYTDKKEEVVQNLTDLGYASGVDEKFFEDFITEIRLSDDTKDYLTEYYEGKRTGFDTTAFKTDMLEGLKKYAKDKELGEINEKNVQYLVDKAATVYRNSIEIPLYSKIAGVVNKLGVFMPIVILSMVGVVLIIAAVLFLTNKWKHRAVKLYFCSFAGAFLSSIILPAVMLISNYIKNINLESRALYNVVVDCVNNFFNAVLICSVLYLLLAALMLLLYSSMKKKASK